MSEKVTKYSKPVAQRKLTVERAASLKLRPLLPKKRVLYSGKNDCIIIDDDDDDNDIQCLGSYKTSPEISKKFRHSVKDDDVIILNGEPNRLKTKLDVCKPVGIANSTEKHSNPIESANPNMNTYIPLHDFTVSDPNVCTLAQPFNSGIPTPPSSGLIAPQSQGFATLSLTDRSNVIVSGPPHNFPVASLPQDPNVPTFIQIQDFPMLNSSDIVITQAPALTPECMTLPNGVLQNGTVLSNNSNARVPARRAESVARINNVPSYVEEQQALLTFRPNLKHELRRVDIPVNKGIAFGSTENNEGQMLAATMNSTTDEVIEQIKERPANKRAHSKHKNDYKYIQVITDTDTILHEIKIKPNKRKKKNVPKKVVDDDRNVHSKQIENRNEKQVVEKPGQFSIKDLEEFENLKSMPNAVPQEISDEIMPCDLQKTFNRGTQTSIHCWLFKNDNLYSLDDNVGSECNIRLEPVGKLRMDKNPGKNKNQSKSKGALNKEVPDSSVAGSCEPNTSDLPTMPTCEVDHSVSQSEKNTEIHHNSPPLVEVDPPTVTEIDHTSPPLAEVDQPRVTEVDHTSPPLAEVDQPRVEDDPAHGVFESGSAFTENTYLTLGLPVPTQQRGVRYEVDHIVPQNTETARSMMSETNGPSFTAPPGDQTDPPNMFPRSAATATVANLPAPYINLFNKICEDIRNALKFDKDCNIPLHDAVIDCDLKRVKSQCILLKGMKSNLNHRNVHGDTPLMLAVKLAVDLGGAERWKVVQMLLKEGADQTVADREEYTPLHYAVQYGSTNLVRTLLGDDGSHKVIDKFCRNGLAPLHLAAIGGHDDIIEMLIDAKADFNCKDMKSGRTPYFFALEKENTSSAKIFVKFKAKVNEPNFAGQYPPTKTLKVNQGDDCKVDNKSLKNSASSKAPFNIAETTSIEIEEEMIEDPMVVEEDGISGSSFTDLGAPVAKSKEQNCDISNLNRINEVETALCRKSLDLSERTASGPNYEHICPSEITNIQPSPDTISIENQMSHNPSLCPLSTSDSPILPLNYDPQEQHQCHNNSSLRAALEMNDSNHVGVTKEKQKDITEILKNSLNIPSKGDKKSKSNEIKKTRNHPLSRIFSQTLDIDKSFNSCENAINNSSSNLKPQDIIQPTQPHQIKKTLGNISHSSDPQYNGAKSVSSNENTQKIIQLNVSECAGTKQTPIIQSSQIMKSHQNSNLNLNKELNNSRSLLSDAETQKLVPSSTSKCEEIKQSSCNQPGENMESHGNSCFTFQDHSNDAEFVLSDDDDSDEDTSPSDYTTAKPTAEVAEHCNKRTKSNNSTERLDLEKLTSNRDGLHLARIDHNKQGSKSAELNVNEEIEEHVESRKTNLEVKNKPQRKSKRKISEEQLDDSLSTDRRKSLRKSNAPDSLGKKNDDEKSNQRTKQAKMSKTLPDSKSIPSNIRSRRSQDNVKEKQEEVLDSTKRTSKACKTAKVGLVSQTFLTSRF
ncbi:uncharacterized protein LOC124354626 isoform X1 [Homalodisca vitripennis]|uniref:uncharacterized protein LOC124354626 isoform X1 n=1 Tax=Homalodisca vitripennis TaxID=197043 RepID=UPI001EEA797E|nr:uncharacterized protein LOC124354626 isoform X1 [Homalodisca vitripennis]